MLVNTPLWHPGEQTQNHKQTDRQTNNPRHPGLIIVDLQAIGLLH